MKRSLQIFIALSTFLLFSLIKVFSQTIHVDPSGAGGFESGVDFTSNGWTASNGTQTNQWFVGSVATPNAGTNSAYISSSPTGATYDYNVNAASVTSIYREITIPAGESVLETSFIWKSAGETCCDYMRVWLTPTSYTPTPGTQTTAALSGGIQLGGNINNNTTYNSALLAASVIPGNSYRIIFEWRNDGSIGPSPAVSLDNVSILSRPPGTFISIITGNWNNPLTWDANAVPTIADNAIVSTGHVVTVNAVGQGINNLTVNGTLAYATTPTQFNVNGNLTVNSGGLVNVYNGTTGKSLFVSGNILNNGRIDISIGATTAGVLNLNGTTVQNIAGSGTWGGLTASTTNTNTVGVIRNLTCSNTNTSIPNITWGFNNVRIVYNLNITGAKIDLLGNTLYFGNYAGPNTFTAPATTGFLNGTFSRYWIATQTGSAITAGVDPTTTTSRYPFLTPTGVNRIMYISRTGGTTGSTAGYLAVNYFHDDNTTTGLSIDDAGYIITDRYDGSWTVTSSDGYGHNNGHSAAILANNTLVPLNGNGRILLANAPAGGLHQNGTVTPGAQRATMSLADLTAGPLHIGIASADNQYPCAGTPVTPTINASALSLCQGVNDTLTATGLATNTLGLSYQWQISTTLGGPYTNISGATAASAIVNDQLSPGTNYVVLKTTCANSLDFSYSNELVINVNGADITSTPPNFCGTGGTAAIELIASSAYDSIQWTSLTPNGTITVYAEDSIGFNVQETSDYSALIYFSSGAACPVFGSLGVYPLPSATVTTDADGVCPGTSATINSGLSAGNFSSVSIPHAPRTAPANAVTLVTGGVATPATNLGFGLDDGGWSAIPIGFGFNFFGTIYNTVSIGTNGTVFMGNTGNVGDFTFTTLPSTTEPFNMIAVLAMDNNLGSLDGGTIKYWTEGYAPNRKFIVSYQNVKEFGDTKYSTSQAIFFETTGIVEVHVTSSTNIDRNKLVGINNNDGTVGVLAFASGTTASANNPITNPFAYRFTPPSNYATLWTAIDANGSTVLSDSVNVFSLAVSPNITTTYDISYTNELTGCSNTPGSAQVTMNVLGQIAPTGVLATASVDSVCVGETVTLTADYTGSTDGLVFQWQVSLDGVNFIDVPNQNQLTFTSDQLTNTTYRMSIISCGGTPSYTSSVLVPMGSCYLMTNGNITTCSGTLYDAGGLNGDYQGNEFYTLTITPSTPGSLMQINFTTFDVESGYDFLSIYNGNTTASPLIGTYDSSPGSITSTAPDGSLTLQFTSDFVVQQTGWIASLACVLPPSNDSTCNAITIAVNGVVNTFNNGGATVQVGETAIAPIVTTDQDLNGWGDNSLSATTWYKFTAPASGQIKLYGSDVEFDGQIAVYSVGSCSDFATFSLIAANDNSLLDASVAPGFSLCSLTPGAEYYIMHDSREDSQTGPFSIKISDLVVTAGTPTTAINVCSGESVELFDGLVAEDTGGVWTQGIPTLGLNGSTFNSIGLAYQDFDFTYTVVDGCASDSATVIVTITGPSSAGNDGTITACKNEPINLLSGLSGNVDLGGAWYDPGNQLIPSPEITTSNFPGQYNYDYISGNGICPDDTANVLLIVDLNCDYLTIGEMALNEMVVYPNPSFGIVHIANEVSNESFNYTVSDMNGRQILSKDMGIQGMSTTSIDLLTLENGVYFIRVFNTNAEKVFRVILE